MLKYLRMGSKRTKAIWWALIVLTVGTFVGGFIFLFGAGLDVGMQAQITGALGMVDGEPITRAEFQDAMTQQREAYRQQYKSEPVEQAMQLVEVQAWRGVVTQHLMDRSARRLGLKATNPEVVLSLKSSPPQLLVSAPNFLTDGRFDPNKYAAALRNPNINWSPFEKMVREQLPTRKLQERLVASLKLSQPELADAYRNRFEKVALTGVQVPPAELPQVPPPSAADMDRVYEKYKGRFSGPARVVLEILEVPRKFSAEEVRAAREQAKSLAERARRGESFADLARDYSEGTGAEKGGEIDRFFQPGDFGPDLAAKMMAMQKGDISDPIPDPGRFTILKVIDRIQNPPSPVPSLKVAQITIKVRPSETSLRDQLQELRQLRARAQKVGLGRAAVEKGLATSKTEPFPLGQTSPQLARAPQAVDWSAGAKIKDLSPIFEGLDEYFLAQMLERRPAGPPSKQDLAQQLRPIAEGEARVAAARPRADQILQAVTAGKTLELAAQAAGLSTFRVDGMSRQQPDPKLAISAEAVGAAFGAPAGRTVGPIESPAGWFILRVDSRIPADSAAFEQLKGQISSSILERKQREFFTTWIAEQRLKAKIRDLRTP
ncbi:MAG TPA: peptidyl-prolyl cis-trans isomerase [Candidatus Eisenbacteria bacterium]|jgi:peptidyl-prolyl cis-trans isomerase D